MWVLPEKRMCFLANPKTASLATAFTLETLGFEHYGDQHAPPAGSGWEHRDEIDGTWTTFCTVRNHFDTMVSWYFHQTRTPGTSKYFGWPFEKFLYTWAQNPRWFRDGKMYWERWPLCNKVLRYETLQAGFDELLASHEFPQTMLQVHNVGKNREKRAHHAFYSEKSIEFMRDTFGAEMCLLNYGCWS